MSDTHINAYFEEVAQAEKRVLQAHAEWETAKNQLEAKKKEVGYEELETEPTQKPEKDIASVDNEKSDADSRSKSIFHKNR